MNLIISFFMALLAIGGGFYLLQNTGLLPGGGIAVSKILWLAMALQFWYVIPTIVIFEKGLAAGNRRLVHIFAANMWARAVIELFMMYVTLNWHPYYGIAHDFASALLLIVLFRGCQGAWFKWYNGICVLMFLVEAYFANYMLKNVIGKPGEKIYYVPDSPEHQTVLITTWFAVALTMMGLLLLHRLSSKRD